MDAGRIDGARVGKRLIDGCPGLVNAGGNCSQSIVACVGNAATGIRPSIRRPVRRRAAAVSSAGVS